MRFLSRVSTAVCSVTLAMTSACSSPSTSALSNPVKLEWRELAPLPDPIGLKGMYAGLSNGHVILAGGSNFPIPQRAGGRKTFHRVIYTQPLPLTANGTWTTSGELPSGLAEGAAVTTDLGVLCLGGHDGNAPVASVFLLEWDLSTGTVARRALPDLPIACTSNSAAYVDGAVYVAGGESTAGALRTLWRLDLKAALGHASRTAWENLPAWPGPPRFGGILIPVTTSAGLRLLLASGLSGPARSMDDYLRDAWIFNPARREWSAGAMLPRGAVLGSALTIPAVRLQGGAIHRRPAASFDHVLLLGGSDGHDFERMKALGEQYRIPNEVLLYSPVSDAWSVAGTMPLGTVGAAVVDLGDRWLVVGGEYSPGLRTSRVFELRVHVESRGVTLTP
jgi:N-acetylneuraminic acid mutarotase